MRTEGKVRGGLLALPQIKEEKKMKKRTKKFTPSARQMNPDMLMETTLGGIQVWVGSSLTRCVSLDQARDMVKSGQWFVISGEAIGKIEEDGII